MDGCVCGWMGEWATVLTSNFAQSSLSCSSFPFGKIALTSAFEAFMGMLDAFIPLTHRHTILRRSFKRANTSRYWGDPSFILVQGDPDDCGSLTTTDSGARRGPLLSFWSCSPDSPMVGTVV